MTLVLPAQVWAEAGDAGNLAGSAQVPAGAGALTTITGAVASGDTDMYLIQVNTAATFSATTVGATTFDTQLFLFSTDGRGVTFNDDSIGLQSTITSTFVLLPGKYYIAVSAWDNDPVAKGGQLWIDTPYAIERAPDGPRRLEAADGWTGGGGTGTYTITLTGASFPAQEAVMPDYQYLCESQTQLGNGGVTTWWRQGGGRFQIIYEASHLTGTAGVTGPISLSALKFRGEDGEPNVGGQSWVGVTVQVGSTSLSSATMTTNFATNRLAATTTMGLAGLTTVTVLPSLGTTPNNYNIVIDLAAIGASIVYDPTSGEPNLLIDITIPAAATVPVTSGAVMPFQDSIGTVAQVRGEGVTTATPAAATGSTSATPPVVGIEFAGSGGFNPPLPARNEFFGAGCGASPSSFYQTFLQGQTFDLTGLTLTPDNLAAPNFYAVTGTAGAFDATKVNAVPNTATDDTVITHPLGFTFNYPGASTTTIKPCTNGFAWLDSTMTSNDLTGTPPLLLGSSATATANGARLALFWMDLHAGRNTATHPNSGLHAMTDVSGGVGNAVCYVTWFNCGYFNSNSTAGAGGHSLVNVQCVLYEATGVIEFRYGAMPTAGSGSSVSAILTGFSRGRVGGIQSVDPQSRDLSVEVPFVTSIEVAGQSNMGQTAVATPEAGGAHYSGRMYAGQTIRWNANNVPPGTVFGAQLLDFASTRPGWTLPLLRPGCIISTGLSPIVHELTIFPTLSVLGTAGFTVPPGYTGLEIVAQYVVLDSFGFVVSSNALKHTIGLD